MVTAEYTCHTTHYVTSQSPRGMTLLALPGMVGLGLLGLMARRKQVRGQLSYQVASAASGMIPGRTSMTTAMAVSEASNNLAG